MTNNPIHEKSPHRYVIIGAGAVGGILAAQLTQAGISNVLVARGEQLNVLRDEDLRIFRPTGEDHVRLNVVGSPGDLVLTTSDILVLATKTQDAEAVLQDWSWQPLADSDSATAAVLPIVTLQNGLETERAALRRFVTVYAATTWAAATYVKPGEMSAAGVPKVGVFWIGRFPSGKDERLEAIASDLRSAQYLVQTVADIKRWKAAKLVGNLRNAVQVLSGSEDEKTQLTTRLSEETKKVLHAAGIDFADIQKESTIDLNQYAAKEIKEHPGSKLSTWQSFQRGARAIEVDFLNGEVVLLGRLNGVPTPFNEAIQTVLGKAALAGEGPGIRTVAQVFAIAQSVNQQPKTKFEGPTWPRS